MELDNKEYIYDDAEKLVKKINKMAKESENRDDVVTTKDETLDNT